MITLLPRSPIAVNIIRVYCHRMITAVQSRMARAAVGWGVRDLAKHAQVGVTTITRFENEQGAPIPSTRAAIQRALEAAGVVFTANGVELARKEAS